MVRCYIGLGSNLDNPIGQIRSAVQSLRQLDNSTLTCVSPFYWSSAVGPAGQDDYLNGVVALDTKKTPEELLDALQAIENAQGRIRSIRWGSRTLDLDLLLYGVQIINTDRLVVPHPEILNRDFVIRPLIDIDHDICLPDGTKLSSRLDYCPNNHLRPVTTSF